MSGLLSFEHPSVLFACIDPDNYNSRSIILLLEASKPHSTEGVYSNKANRTNRTREFGGSPPQQGPAGDVGRIQIVDGLSLNDIIH